MGQEVNTPGHRLQQEKCRQELNLAALDSDPNYFSGKIDHFRLLGSPDSEELGCSSDFQDKKSAKINRVRVELLGNFPMLSFNSTLTLIILSAIVR